MSKAFALRRCCRLARYGADLRSQAVLMGIGAINQLDHRRRLGLLARIHAGVARASSDGLLELRVYLRSRALPFPVALRARDGADYRSLFECWAARMYPVPAVPIRHVFDGGANIGFFSMAAALMPSVTDIVAVEPHGGNLSLLGRNTSLLSQLGIDVSILPVALAAREGTVSFALASANMSHVSGAAGHRHTPTRGTVNVASARLSGLLPRCWEMEATWLKLDIEGMEYDVLPELLEGDRLPAVISAELHDYLGAGGERLVGALEDAGYRVEIDGVGTSGNVCRQIHACRAA